MRKHSEVCDRHQVVVLKVEGEHLNPESGKQQAADQKHRLITEPAVSVEPDHPQLDVHEQEQADVERHKDGSQNHHFRRDVARVDG